jgi:hypothetical protein
MSNIVEFPKGNPRRASAPSRGPSFCYPADDPFDLPARWLNDEELVYVLRTVRQRLEILGWKVTRISSGRDP